MSGGGLRLGVDFGGTKIEAAALAADGRILSRLRRPNPGGYEAAVRVVAELAAAVEAEAGGAPGAASVGVGVPGSVSPRTGVMRNANSVWLNGRPFRHDLQAALGRPVRLANDANCLALSEAADGAGAGFPVVFAAILGTGCGGGVVVDGRQLDGRNGVAGEWGHTPLPWARDDERPPNRCWCGREGCLETYIAGTGLALDYNRAGGAQLTGQEVAARAAAGEPAAAAALGRYIDRLGRALAVIVDVLDPDCIVLGGGMSNVDALYDRTPEVIGRWCFSDVFETPLRRPVHGDSSGVRGAAWLWPLEGPAP